MNFYIKALGAAAVLISCSVGCTTVKPYEKEYLLHPLMDEQQVSKISPVMLPTICSGYEKLASGGPGASGGTSCPTCGG